MKAKGVYTERERWRKGGREKERGRERDKKKRENERASNYNADLLSTVKKLLYLLLQFDPTEKEFFVVNY